MNTPEARMNKISQGGFWIFAALALGLSSLACGKGTYLEVQLKGTGLPEIRSISMDLTLTDADGGVTTAHGLVQREDKGIITLPTSMALKLDSESGALALKATALGKSGQEVATASKSTTIMHDQTWTIEMTLAAITSP